MGEVYLARDTRLERQVALKILPLDFTQSHDRLRRFEQEAKTVSALNHPKNMRKAMPKANYIAFTGTPLLDAVETTKEWFGDYVSRYDFADSVADGSTVPIFYQN